jgi:hypothetical protein
MRSRLLNRIRPADIKEEQVGHFMRCMAHWGPLLASLNGSFPILIGHHRPSVIGSGSMPLHRSSDRKSNGTVEARAQQRTKQYCRPTSIRTRQFQTGFFYGDHAENQDDRNPIQPQGPRSPFPQPNCCENDGRDRQQTQYREYQFAWCRLCEHVDE